MIKTLAHKILAIPLVFDFYQWLIGAPACHSHFMRDVVSARAGQRILDIGCGIGAGLRYLPEGIEYVGVDISAPYIDQASKAYHDRGTFICADLTQEDPARYGQFDIAYAFGVLHHLNDDQINRLVAFVQAVLKPGGKFVSIDPCYKEGQSLLKRTIISHDRGEYVRTSAGYRSFFLDRGDIKSRYLENILRIPYTQIIIEYWPKATGNAKSV